MTSSYRAVAEQTEELASRHGQRDVAEGHARCRLVLVVLSRLVNPPQPFRFDRQCPHKYLVRKMPGCDFRRTKKKAITACAGDGLLGKVAGSGYITGTPASMRAAAPRIVRPTIKAGEWCIIVVDNTERLCCQRGEGNDEHGATPGSLGHLMLPHADENCAAIESPEARPISRERAWSTRNNRSNTRGTASAGMPIRCRRPRSSQSHPIPGVSSRAP